MLVPNFPWGVFLFVLSKFQQTGLWSFCEIREKLLEMCKQSKNEKNIQSGRLEYVFSRIFFRLFLISIQLNLFSSFKPLVMVLKSCKNPIVKSTFSVPEISNFMGNFSNFLWQNTWFWTITDNYKKFGKLVQSFSTNATIKKNSIYIFYWFWFKTWTKIWFGF